MSKRSDGNELNVISQQACGGCCNSIRSHHPQAACRAGISCKASAPRAWPWADSPWPRPTSGQRAEPVPADQPFPRGAALRVKPILVFDVPTRGDRTSWRSYGAIQTPEAAREEAARIEQELSQLQQKAEFPIQMQPVELLDSQAKLTQVAVNDTDLCIVYAAGAVGEWPLKTPMIMFVRHRSGPFYLGFEIAHWRFLRGNGDQLRGRISMRTTWSWIAATNCCGVCGRCTA